MRGLPGKGPRVVERNRQAPLPNLEVRALSGSNLEPHEVAHESYNTYNGGIYTHSTGVRHKYILILCILYVFLVFLEPDLYQCKIGYTTL